MLSLTLSLLINLTAASEPVRLSGTVVDSVGKPVAGAMVVVAEGPPTLRFVRRVTPESAPRPPDVVEMTTTDDAGEFAIDLPPEAPEYVWRRTRLAIWAHRADHALALRLIDRDWPRAGLPLSLVLPEAESVRLKITDSNWRPIGRARVAPARISGQLVPAIIAERLAIDADAQGRATLTGLSAEDLELLSIRSETHGIQWAGFSGRGQDNIALVPLAAVGSLTGHLMADDPRAVRQRRIRFATWQIPGDERAGGGLAEVTTDDGGAFDVPTIAAGSLTFEVEGAADPVFLSAQTSDPDVEAGKTTRFEIPLRRAVAVTQDVRDEDDKPIAGVRVSMKFGLPVGAANVTDPSGRLTVHVLPGRVTSMPLRIPVPFYYPKAFLTGGIVPDDAESFELKPMQLARGVTLRGRVVDADKQPVAGAEVAGFWPLPATTDSPVHAWTGADGEFAIEGVPADAGVYLWASHGESTNRKPIVARPGGEPVIVAVDGTSAVSLEGRVVDAAGNGVAGAHVRVEAEQQQFATDQDPMPLGSLLFDGSDRLTTDADGRFRTPRRVRPNARYSLEVEAPGMARVETEAIEPDTWQTTQFADAVLHLLPRLRTIAGRVVDHDGRPVAGANVWQSGDGPRRTETRSDADGRFELGGLYDGPAFVFARKDGFRLQCSRVGAADKTCEIALRASDTPQPAITALPPRMSLEEQRALGRSLLEPLLPILNDRTQAMVRGQLFNTIARVNPAEALRIAQELKDESLIAVASQETAISLVTTDIDRAIWMIPRLEGPYQRVHTCLRANDRLDGPASESRQTLLEEALRQAHAEPDQGSRAYLLGRIGAAWLDLGERERGTALLREGQALAESLPSPTAENGQSFTMQRRGRFAGLLARIDGPAAIRLLDGYSPAYYLYYYQIDVACGLADHDPAEAERVLALVPFPPMPSRARLSVLWRMAVADSQRATRLARSFPDACEEAFALGTVAHGLAAKDRAGAARLLEEAYVLLDNASPRPAMVGVVDHRAVTAAALLPVAEKIDPTLVHGYLWRTLSLRKPYSSHGDADWNDEGLLAATAAMVARYDRDAARDLLQPLAGRLRDAMAEAETSPFRAARPLLMAMAMTDMRWAAELVDALPDAPQLTKSPRRIAARLLAEWLGLTPHEAWSLVYTYSGFRDFDARGEAR